MHVITDYHKESIELAQMKVFISDKYFRGGM